VIRAAARLTWALLAAAAAAAAPDQGPARTQVILRYDCSSEVGRREITLFANGTVRVRDGLRKETPLMLLGELGPDEMNGFLNRLRGEDLSEVTAWPARGVEGPWIERCRLELDLGEQPGEPERPARAFEFGRYDSLPLNLMRVVRVAEDIGGRADPRSRDEQLPPGYEPRPGDVLRRVDGALFEIASFTADGLGVELVGLREPLTLYLPKGELGREFVALERRRSP
jgi:hypothetical protein